MLQAKMDNFWAQQMERAKAQPNLLGIPICNTQAKHTPDPAAPVQGKLAIGEPDDHCEQEPDQVAEQVIKTPALSEASQSQPSQNSVHGKSVTPSTQQLLGFAHPDLFSHSPQRRPLINPFQAKLTIGQPSPIQTKRSGWTAANIKSTNNQQQEMSQSSLPQDLQANIESMSGHPMDDVKVHLNSSKPAEFNALAYTQGTEIYVAPGQEEHLPHEAWHVVQQKQGRVQATDQIQGMSLNDNSELEREADEMGAQALQRKESLSPTASVLNHCQAHSQSLCFSSAPIQRQRSEQAPFNEVDNLLGEQSIEFTPGEITRSAEGTGSRTLTIHWPRTPNSGVTLGYGYDMGNRNRAEIIRDLTNAGVSAANSEHLADAAGLRGNHANDFVTNHATDPWATITDAQRTALFNQIYPNYQSRARSLATDTHPVTSQGAGVNAAGRGEQYVVPTEIYDHLHPVILEILTDLTYPGQYSYGRHEIINPILNDYRLSTLEKLRAIRDYFNAATTRGIGRAARIRMRTQLIDQAISEIEQSTADAIVVRREQIMALPATSSEQQAQLQSELEQLEQAYANQHPLVSELAEVYQEDLTILRENLEAMPETNSVERVRLESRIRILEQMYGSTN